MINNKSDKHIKKILGYLRTFEKKWFSRNYSSSEESTLIVDGNINLKRGSKILKKRMQLIVNFLQPGFWVKTVAN